MITVVGLGPGSLSRVPTWVTEILLDPDTPIVLRTIEHPAAVELSELRSVSSCDDLYMSHEHFDDVYTAIVERLQTIDGDVIYAVPGSPLVGEFVVKRLVELTPDIEILPAESFIDAILTEVGYDPLDRGLQILNGHEPPDPLVLDKPTIIGNLDRPEILADVLDAIGRVTGDPQEITLLRGVGAKDAVIRTALAHEHDLGLAGIRTSIFLDPEPAGLIGAVQVMRRLRAECPWDRDQTHQSLVKNLVEETHELVDAISQLGGDEDWVGYAGVEDELGDVLLQVLFHTSIAAEAGVFDIDGVAGVLIDKLIRRHPHVFGDVEADTPEEVKRNWDRIKATEDGRDDVSALDGIPVSMPALQRASKVQNRAAKVGFDWDEATEVMPKVVEELDELSAAIGGDGDISSELGDLMFSIVNLSRHLGIDPELAIRSATNRFETRFRLMEADGSMEGLSLTQLDERWERAKAAEAG